MQENVAVKKQLTKNWPNTFLLRNRLKATTYYQQPLELNSSEKSLLRLKF